MKYLSVCSGIEAASVAWRPIGWTPVAFSEIEPFPCAVLKHHYPDVPNWGDMTKYQEWPDATIDLLCGGTPCQSFSVAGLRKGLADPRGNLMLTFGAIAAKYRPQWVVWENVPGVLSSNGGKDFGTFLGMLAELGYGFAYRILDAQYFGIPQRRRRVFVVGCLGDWRAAAAVLFERHSLSGHPAPSREEREGIAGTLNARTEGGGFPGTDEACGGYIQPICAAHGQGGAEIGFNRAPTLTCNHEAPIAAYCATGQITHTLKAEGSDGSDGSEDGTGRGVPVVAFVQNSRDEVRMMGGNGQVVGALAAEPGAKQQCYVAFSADAQTDQLPTSSRDTSVTDTLTGSQRMAMAMAMQVRRLTPTECERLQGFPDSYTLVPHRGKPAADGPRYKALGNSWAVPCAAWIGQRIDNFLKEHP